ncbi:MAG TPA: hypothetical protein O0X50_01760 [Methanocorpusculum sp.]|nr:hypothetical protein [Methanocorpusculum sp.]
MDTACFTEPVRDDAIADVIHNETEVLRSSVAKTEQILVFIAGPSNNEARKLKDPECMQENVNINRELALQIVENLQNIMRILGV